MKAEFITMPNKGLCILISDFSKEDITNFKPVTKSPFRDAYAIADQMRINRKIAAIKEVRSQTGWGLRDAKLYMDQYMPNNPFATVSVIDSDYAADRFIADHVVKDFLNIDDVTI